MEKGSMRVVIPVKMSERLPFKHFLTLGGVSLLELAIRKAEKVGDPLVLSSMPLPVQYVHDSSRNIVELMNILCEDGQPFILLAPDMPFITESDMELLIRESDGHTLVPISPDGTMEPLFAFYSGKLHFEGNLHSGLISAHVSTINTERFSELAFFNVNTPEDYWEAVLLFRGRHPK